MTRSTASSRRLRSRPAVWARIRLRRLHPRRLRRRPPNRWTVVTAAGVVIGTVVLLWICDGLSRIGSQSLVAHAVQQQTGVSDRPSVRVHGRFFLPQVARGHYDHVDIDVRAITSGPLRIERVQASLHGVHLPFHDVLVQDVHSLLIDHTTERARLDYDDLNRYLKITGRPVTIEGRRDGRVRLTGTVTVLGKRISASAVVKVSGRDGTLMLVPTALDTGVTSIDGAVRLLLQQRFTVQVPLQALPFGQQITGVDAEPGALVVHAEGTSVVIQG